MKKKVIQTGSRVKVFDNELFKDDVTTPLSHTMRSATVVQRYAYTNHLGYFYPDVIDVVFDHRPHDVSIGHFIEFVEAL